MKFEIKNRFSRNILFAVETDSIKLAVELGVKSGADLSGADLSRADLSGANLSGADLSRADLSGADLSRADLSGADLSRADLSRANLSRAYLYGADLSRAKLYGADLSRAKLYGAKNISKYRTSQLYMLMDQVGKIRAYKLVNKDNRGPIHGGIKYEIGKTVKCDADTDEKEHCSHGISLATLDWCMSEWQNGYKILVVEFTAKDIAAIPIGTDGKFRVRKCRVVGEKDLTELGLVGDEGK